MDGLFHGKSKSKMDDEQGFPIFRKPLCSGNICENRKHTETYGKSNDDDDDDDDEGDDEEDEDDESKL